MDPAAAPNAPDAIVPRAASQLDRIFKTIVIISLATSVISFVKSYLVHLWASEEALDLLGWSGYEAILIFPTSFWTLWMLVLIAVRMGLLVYSPAARAAFTLLTVQPD